MQTLGVVCRENERLRRDLRTALNLPHDSPDDEVVAALVTVRARQEP